MNASVESAFILIDRASGPIKRIRSELKETRLEAERTGKALDDVGGPRHAKQLEQQARSFHAAQTGAGGYADQLVQTSRRSRQLDKDNRTLGSSVRLVGNTLRGLQSIMRLLKWPALLAGVGVLTQLVGGLGAGLTTLLPMVGDLAGLSGAAIPLVTGLGLALGVTKLATKDLTDAYGGNEKALKRLTPEGRGFLEVLRSYKPIIRDLRREAQQGLFPGMTDALDQLRGQRGAARKIVRQTAGDVGSLARFVGGELGGKRLNSRSNFMGDLVNLSAAGGRSMNAAGRSGFYLADAVRHVGVAAIPFTDRLGVGVEHLAKMVDQEAAVARETGRLERFFNRSEKALDRLGSVGKNVWGGIGGTLRSARGEGDLAWTSIDRLTTRWDDWANSARGQTDMRRYFTEMRPVVKETAGLVGDIAKAVADIARGPEAAMVLHELRDSIPEIAAATKSLTQNFGPAAAQAITELIQLFATLTQSDGSMTIFVRFLGTTVNLLDHILRLSGPVGTALLTAFGGRALLRRIGGIQQLGQAWGMVAGNAGAAARAQRGAAGGMGVPGMAAPAGAMPATGGGMTAIATGGRPMPMAAGGVSAGGVILPAGASRGAGSLAGRTAASGGAGLIARARAGMGAGWAAASAPGSARAFGGGAGRMIGPTALLMGLMSGAGTQGDFGQRLQGGLSGLTFGLLPGPTTGAMRKSNAGGAAQEFIGGLPQGSGIGAQQRGVARLRTGIETAPGSDKLGDADTYSYLQALRQELKLRRDILRETKVARKEERDRRSVIRAHGLMEDLGKAFDIRAGHEGPVKAMEKTTGAMLARMERMRPAGRKVIAENTLAWARQQARGNPEMQAVVDRMQAGILRTYKRLGRNVVIVNGEILTGSKRQWGSIADALGTSSERAKQEVSEDFTAIQQKAVGALSAMGFSPSEARKLVAGMEKGGQAGKVADLSVRQGVSGAGQSVRQQSRAQSRGRARGGRLPGQGMQDTVPMSDGGWGAPDEVVVNRHGERDIDAYLAAHGQSVDKIVNREGKRHASPFTSRPRYAPSGRRSTLETMRYHGMPGRATGGFVRVPGDPDTTGGRDRVAAGIADEVASWIRRYKIQIGYAYDPGGGHKSPGHNVTGTALDVVPGVGGSWDSVEAGLRAAVSAGKTVYYGTNGVGTPLAGHGRGNHGHVEWGGGGAVGGRGVGGGAAAAIQQINPLTAPETDARGLPGVLVDVAKKQYAAALTAKINKHLRGAGAGTSDFNPGGGQLSRKQIERLWISAGGPPNLAHQMANVAWSESRWNTRAHNASGASGLWQIMMPLHQGLVSKYGGDVFDPLTNAKAAVDLYRSSGLSPWAASQAVWGQRNSAPGAATGRRIDWGGWHAKGLDASFDRPTMIGVGERGRERVKVMPTASPTRRGGSTVRGPLVVLQDGAIRISGGDPDETRRIVRGELDRFADLIVEEIADGQEDEQAVLD